MDNRSPFASISFGQWVRRRRKALDLSQEELARQVACSLAMVKKVEADGRRPSSLMAERLAESLQVPEQERKAFIQAARAQRSPDRLPPAHASVSLTSEPPPLLPSESTNLPAHLTRLVGREKDLDGAGHLLRDTHTRLLTLTGPGGVGKTRLALQLAADSAPHFPGGVWLVELASIFRPRPGPPAGINRPRAARKTRGSPLWTYS